MLPNPITTVADVQLSPEVRDFCERHQLLDPLAKAIELVKRCFSVVDEPTVVLEQDPEDGEWYLVMEVRCRGDESESIQRTGSITGPGPTPRPGRRSTRFG